MRPMFSESQGDLNGPAESSNHRRGRVSGDQPHEAPPLEGLQSGIPRRGGVRLSGARPGRDHQGRHQEQSPVDRAVEGADFVVHTAAALPLYSPQDIYTTDVEGTRNVLDACLRHGVKRFVHVSSTAVYGIPDHHPLYETDRLEGVGPYGQAKIQAEMICLEYRARGMTVPIIRPKSF